MALRSGYYGLKKKLLNKVIGLPGIKTIGTGLSLSSAGELSSNVTGGVDYSTTEQNTGCKWIDDRPIYQKTIAMSIDEITSVINHGISGLDKIIDLEGSFKLTSAIDSSVAFLSLNKMAISSTGEASDASYSVGVNFINADSVSIRVGRNIIDKGNYSSVDLDLTLYYTKTS